jgi:hypothetical protein
MMEQSISTNRLQFNLCIDSELLIPSSSRFYVVQHNNSFSLLFVCLFVCILLTKTGARTGDLNYSAFEESVYNETRK